jgi:hypothetical protein
MMKRVVVTVLSATAIAGLAAVVPHTLAAADESNLTVHEWGTFTSIAGPDGQAVEWRPLTGPTDLPCFVTTLNPSSIKVLPTGGIPGVKARVRMETPVLYFYAPADTTARVSVTFPQGIFSEWYPQARNTPAPLVGFEKWRGQLQWQDVKVTPGAKEVFPTESDDSHYYAARETDAAPVSVGGQQEKFLFYRGVANFEPPVLTTVTGDGRIAVEQRESTAIDTVVLFERRSGQMGYRIVHPDGKIVVIDRPDLTGDIESLRQDLRAALTEQGLYPREAAAMVETWRDSWFDEGTRLFYLLPQVTVDRLLPLDIDPKPASVARVFVGRMEIVTPEIETEIASAIQTKNQAILRKYGRFLEPISQMIEARLRAAADQKRIDEALKVVSSSSHAVCTAPRASGPAPIQ